MNNNLNVGHKPQCATQPSTQMEPTRYPPTASITQLIDMGYVSRRNESSMPYQEKQINFPVETQPDWCRPNEQAAIEATNHFASNDESPDRQHQDLLEEIVNSQSNANDHVIPDIGMKTKEESVLHGQKQNCLNEDFTRFMDDPEALQSFKQQSQETRSENQPARRNADDSRNVERNQLESTINPTDAPPTEASNDQGSSTSSSFDNNEQSNDEQDGPPAKKARIGSVVPEGQGDANACEDPLASRRKIAGIGRESLNLFGKEMEKYLNARKDKINASTLLPLVLLQLVDDCVKKLDDPKNPAEIIHYMPGKLTLENFLLNSQLLQAYLKERRDVFTFFKKRIDEDMEKAVIEKARQEALSHLIAGQPVDSGKIMPSTSAIKKKGAGRPPGNQPWRKKIVGKGREFLSLLEQELNARNYKNASTLLQLVDDCVKKLDDPAGNKEKCSPKMPSRPGAKQKKPAPIIYQPGKLTLEDFRLDPQLLSKYLEERREKFDKFEKCINEAMKKADIEEAKRETLKRLKEVYDATRHNFSSDYEEKETVIIENMRYLPVVQEFYDKVVLFEKKKFDRIESVPAGHHCNKAGESDNKKTSLARDAAEVTFYEDHFKEAIALHDELPKIMEVIRPYMLFPDQTAPQQGPSASRPGPSAQAHQEPNRPIAVEHDNCPFLQFLVGDPSINLPELTADEVDEFFRQEVAEERSKLKNASNQIPPKQKKMALTQEQAASQIALVPSTSAAPAPSMQDYNVPDLSNPHSPGFLP